MAQEVLKQILQKKYRTGASNTISGIQTDPLTGKSTKVLVEGAFQETPSDKAARENEQALDLADYQQAQDKGVRAYDELKDLQKNTSLLEEARREVMAGAKTGLLYGSGWIPAFSKETARLEQITKMMGINIINSATFGALSEKEMDLALSVDIDRSLPKDELLKLLDSKIAAQQKLQREIGYYAERLNSGRVKYSDFVTESIQRQKTFDTRNVNRKSLGITNELWEVMTVDERKQFD
jgi:hypothetical protein